MPGCCGWYVDIDFHDAVSRARGYVETFKSGVFRGRGQGRFTALYAGSRYVMLGKVRVAGAVPFRPPLNMRWQSVEIEWMGHRGELLELAILDAELNQATDAACRELEERYDVPTRVYVNQ